jgi:SAM-dependent methyltransferase
MNPISLASAASIIGVSSATIRNWVKAGHLVPVNVRPFRVLEHDVIHLKSSLGSGSLGRLRSRANKSHSTLTTIPKEYAANQNLITTVQCIVDTFHNSNLDLATTMFFLSLRVLELRREVTLFDTNNIHDLSSFTSWRRSSIKTDIYQWQSTLPSSGHKSEYTTIYFALDKFYEDDFLGLVYQSLNMEGDKSHKGSYYTPSNVITESLSQQDFSGVSFLDPCCGTGNYLLKAASILHVLPNDIYGFDSDAIAIRIARLNFLLAFPSYDSPPNIQFLNSLTDLATGELLCQTNHLLSTVDFIATNPPWGAYKNSSIQLPNLCSIESNEFFALFLAKSLTLLREGGKLSFILPESFLKIRTHRGIRSLVLKTTKIIRIVKLGRQFTGVFTPVIRLDLVKQKPDNESTVEVRANGRRFCIDQSRFAKNENYSFDVESNFDEDLIIRKLYDVDHITLAGRAEWALGIVTGNNKKYLHEQRQVGMEEVVRGSDISSFFLRKPKSYIAFDKTEFQQVAKEKFYRAPEKLIYKFISKTLEFVYDDKQRLTLNSANILIPNLPEHSIKVVLAFLNSAVFQYIFMKKYATHKVLRGDLEALPFPIISPNVCKNIEKLVDMIAAGGNAKEELESVIFATFKLADDEIELIRHTVKAENGKAKRALA